MAQKNNDVSLAEIDAILNSNCDTKVKKVKLKIQYFKLEQTNSFISATDISNFTYCPISWAISKSYKLAKSDSAKIGTSFHEEHKLVNYVRVDLAMEPDTIVRGNPRKQLPKDLYIGLGAKDMLRDIADSVVIYVGQSGDDKQTHYFKGKDIYVGQPDYIFFNYKTKKYFVVEEKFHLINKTRDKVLFYENHLNQLSSYIHGIPDYDISYGYLVYWRYAYGHTPYAPLRPFWEEPTFEELENELGALLDSNIKKPVVEQIYAKRVDKKDEYNRKNLIEVYKNIKRAMRNAGGEFDISKLTPSKCSGCVNYILCGHKTKHFNEYSFPYASHYMEINERDFLEEVAKPAKINDWSELLDEDGSFKY